MTRNIEDDNSRKEIIDPEDIEYLPKSNKRIAKIKALYSKYGNDESEGSTPAIELIDQRISMRDRSKSPRLIPIGNYRD